MLRSLAILLLLASSAFAGWQETTLIFLEDGGSGCVVWVNKEMRILSCAHESATSDVRVGQRLRCKLYNDQQFTAVVESVNSKGDCSILKPESQLPSTIQPRTIAKQQPPAGTNVWVCGFPNGSPYTRQATVIGDDGYWLNLQGQAIPGESGGPVIDASGDVVGVLVAAPLVNGRFDGTSMCARLASIQQLCCPRGGGCGSGQCPQVYAQPIQHRPPVPQPRPPQAAPQPAQQPQIDWATKYEKLESDFAGLQLKFDALQKQVGSYKECQCGDCLASVDAKIAVAIAGIKIPQPTPQQPPNYDAIAAEVSKRLPPINMRVTPEAPYQSVKLGSYVTLPLDKQNP